MHNDTHQHTLVMKEEYTTTPLVSYDRVKDLILGLILHLKDDSTFLFFYTYSM